MGLRPGDNIATMGFPLEVYYERLLGAHIGIEMATPNPQATAELPEADVRRIIETLRANGAKALISAYRPGFDHDSGWVRLTKSVYIRML
jgi:hypothetical protein